MTMVEDPALPLPSAPRPGRPSESRPLFKLPLRLPFELPRLTNELALPTPLPTPLPRPLPMMELPIAPFEKLPLFWKPVLLRASDDDNGDEPDIPLDTEPGKPPNDAIGLEVPMPRAAIAEARLAALLDVGSDAVAGGVVVGDARSSGGQSHELVPVDEL